MLTTIATTKSYIKGAEEHGNYGFFEDEKGCYYNLVLYFNEKKKTYTINVKADGGRHTIFKIDFTTDKEEALRHFNEVNEVIVNAEDYALSEVVHNHGFEW